MIEYSENQSILISGESGAGKKNHELEEGREKSKNHGNIAHFDTIIFKIKVKLKLQSNAWHMLQKLQARKQTLNKKFFQQILFLKHLVTQFLFIYYYFIYCKSINA